MTARCLNANTPSNEHQPFYLMKPSQRDLHFGDCFNVLREQLPAESVDLVYLDPPFNSNRNYTLPLKAPDDLPIPAQITAFEDAWRWTEQTEQEYCALLHQPNPQLTEMMAAMLGFLGRNDMLAYLVMLVTRLLPMRRALKRTGSLYLHCDPTASHYIKILLDAVFGKENYRNEISWKRTSAHSSAKRWGSIHDVIFFYTKSNQFIWNEVYSDYDRKYVENTYRHQDKKGRYKLDDLTGAGITQGDSGKPWRSIDPTKVGRHWALPLAILRKTVPQIDLDSQTSQQKLDLLDALGLVYWPPKGKKPTFKHYLTHAKGVPIQDVITDIPPLGSSAKERLGYPTQKPQALLERIIRASSNEGDVILDPFCGCGSTVHAAEILKRQWIGIDTTHLAIALAAKRMRNAFGSNLAFSIYGIPKDIASAHSLADQSQLNKKDEFEYWACSLVNAQPYQGGKKGAAGGIDGLVYFKDGAGVVKKVVVSVITTSKNLGVTRLLHLKGVLQKQKAEMALFVCLTPPTMPMLVEAASAGFYTSPHYKNPRTNTSQWPRMQLLGIEALLSGKGGPLIPGESSTFATTAERATRAHGKD